jgi:hypothetical protein
VLIRAISGLLGRRKRRRRKGKRRELKGGEEG